MRTHTQFRRFTACDPDGRPVVIVASRHWSESADDFGVGGWDEFETADGRAVVRGEGPGVFAVAADGTVLHSDPAEPQG